MFHVALWCLERINPDLHHQITTEHPLWTPEMWVAIDGVNPPKLLEFVDPVFNEAMKDT